MNLTPLQLGAEGTYRGRRYRLTGFVVFEDAATGERWQDWYAEGITGEPMWLSYSQADGSWQMEIEVPVYQPKPLPGVGSKQPFTVRRGTGSEVQLQPVEAGVGRVVAVMGSLPYPYRTGEEVPYFDADETGGMLSAEIIGGKLHVYHQTLSNSAFLLEAFGPKAHGGTAHAPTGYNHASPQHRAAAGAKAAPAYTVPVPGMMQPFASAHGVSKRGLSSHHAHHGSKKKTTSGFSPLWAGLIVAGMLGLFGYGAYADSRDERAYQDCVARNIMTTSPQPQPALSPSSSGQPVQQPQTQPENCEYLRAYRSGVYGGTGK